MRQPASPLRLPSNKAFFGTLVTGVGLQVISMVTGIITARMLGPEGRGLFAAAQLWPTIIAGLGLMGVNHALTLRAARHPGGVSALESVGLILGAMLAALSAVIGLVLLPSLLASQSDVLRLSGLFLIYPLIFIPMSMLQSIDLGVGRFGRFNVSRWIQCLCYLLAILALFLAQIHDPFWYLAALLASNLAPLLYRLTSISAPTWQEMKFHLSVVTTGGGFLVATAIGMARDQIERFFLLYHVGIEALGLYVIALSAAMLSAVLAKSIGLIVFARSAIAETNSGYHDLARLFRMMALVNLCGSAASAVFLPLLIPAFYGAAFGGAVEIALVLIGAQYAMALASVLDEGFRGKGRPWIGTSSVLIMVTVFVAGAIPLYDRLGLVGVAVATVFGHTASLIALIVAFKVFAGDLRLLPDKSDLNSLTRIGFQMAEELWSRAGVAPRDGS